MIKQIKITLLILILGLSISSIIILLKEIDSKEKVFNILEVNKNYELVYNLSTELENKKNTQKKLENKKKEINTKIKDTKNEINNLYGYV